MQKKGELSRLAVNLLIGSLIIILGVVIWIILRGEGSENQEVFTDENIDLKISQVKKVDDNTLDVILKRNLGEGEFVGLSFQVSDGSVTEVIRINSSMPENQSGNFSLNFISINASRVKKVSVTPIYLDEGGLEIIGNVKDEYVTPNTCSNYCPAGAKCGLNDCGMQCGSGCSSGYLCLNYKCIKQKTSSGGGGSTPSCTDTCTSLGYGCGTHTICSKSVSCGNCSSGYTCSTNSTCIENPSNCTDTCSTFGYNCGIKNICNISTNCGTCSTEFICNLTGLCECNSTCSSLGYQCGTRTVCGNSVNCGTCSTGYTCQTNGTCTQNPCTDTCASLVKQCGTQTICGSSVNCGTCSTGYTCSSGLCIPSCVPTTCAALSRTCGTVSDGCGGTLNCGTCSTGYSCVVNGTCIKDCTPTTCSALQRTCGTASNGCSGTLNCGTCSTGYSCAVNGTCIKDVVITCNSITCKSGEYCSNGVCLLNVTGKTYFVATNGNDNNPGTFSQPWKTWQKGVQVARPGDIVYIRGGTWNPTSHILTSGGYDTGAIAISIDPTAQNFGVSGTANAPIRYYNYPGENPIIDGRLLSPNQDRWQSGISVSNAQYIYFKGLTVRNVFQSPPDMSHPKPYSEVFGIGSFNSANLRFENMIVYNINGRGFQHWGGAWAESDMTSDDDFPLFDSDNTSWINCDAYNLFDRYALTPGNAADGWKVVGYPSNYYYWEGCRAWNYSDDGFDPNGAHRFFKNCWAMSTDYVQDLFDEGSSGSWDPEGNGFKISGINPNYPGYSEGGEVFVRMENSIAAYCVGSGVANDIEVNYENQWPNNGVFYNNIVYRTNGGFFDLGSNRGATSRPTEYRNNIAFGSTYDGQGMSPLYEVGIYNPNVYPHSHNTWRATLSEPWPGWEYNPDYSVTDGDFVSVDATQLTLPRKVDGSLPDITFLHLKQGSDLIDGGFVILGYHCSTSGAHPGQNCREWYGAAPDLGPFESNY